MMHILIVTSHLRRGGPVNIIYDLCKEILNYPSRKVYILTLRPETKNSRIEDFRKLGITVHQLRLHYLFCELMPYAVSRYIQKVVNDYNIDIVHCHGYHSVLSSSMLKHVKKLATLHNRAGEDFRNTFGVLMGNTMFRRYIHALNTFDLNIAVSESTCTYYKNWISNVTFVNNGIDTHRFRPINDEEKRKGRASLHLPMDKRIFISTGRIESEKRYEELVEWFCENMKSSSSFLLILGDGSRLSRCKDRAKGFDNIFFTGRVSNTEDYLRCSDYYISYSKSEGMSLAVCEGISCGLFPVLSDIPSHRDVARKINGYFFEKIEDIDIGKLYSQNTDANILHEYIQAAFSHTSMGYGYNVLYQRLINI